MKEREAPIFNEDEPMLIIDPGGIGRGVSEIFAWIAGADGDEGIMGMGELPLVMAKRELAEKLKPFVQQVATTTGKPCRLVRFSQRELLEAITP